MTNLIRECEERIDAIQQANQPPIGIEKDYLDNVTALLDIIKNNGKGE